MKILITGAKGFIGKEIYDSLKKNNEVYGTTTKEDDDPKIFNLDITKKEDFKKLPENLDLIIHLAGVREQFGNCRRNEEMCMKINAEGTRNVLDFAAKTKIKHFIYISSNTVYGNSKRKIKEIQKPKPNTIYGKSKYEGEKYCVNIAKKNNIRLIILRLSSIYGATQDKFLIKYILDSIRKKKDIMIYGEGKGKWDLLYIKDLVRVIKEIIKNKSKGIYNIGSGKLLSVKEIVSISLKSFNSNSKIRYDKNKNEDLSNTLMDISKAKKELGFKIKYDLKKAMKDIKRVL